MKTFRKFNFAFALGLFALMAVAAFAQTTVYWDTNGTTTGASAGTTAAGTWNTTNTDWSTSAAGTGATSNWNTVNAGSKNATFSAGTNATGTFTVTVTGTLTNVGGLTFQDGTVTLGGTGTLDLTGTADVDVAAGKTATISAILGSSGALTKTSTGTLTLSGANNYTGITTISAGVLVAANNTALGQSTSGNIISSGAALELQGGISMTEGSFTVSGTGVGATGAILNNSGTNTLNATVDLGANATIGSTAGTLNITGQMDVGAAGTTLTVAGAGNTNLSGAIFDGGAITKTGTGTLTFSGSGGNSFSGGLNVNSGTVILDKTGGTTATGGGTVNVGDGTGAAGSAVLQIAASNQIPNYIPVLNVNSDGKLTINNGVSQTVDKIGGTGIIDTATSGTFNVGVNSGSSTFGGSITGTGTIQKQGSGTLSLTSNISFGGTFVLAAGTLQLSGTTLTLGTLDISGASVIDFSGSAATLTVTNLLIEAGGSLTIINWQDGIDHFYATNWSGATQNTMGSAPMNDITFTGNSANITDWQSSDNQIRPNVPESSTYGALLLAALLGFFGWRRYQAARAELALRPALVPIRADRR